MIAKEIVGTRDILECISQCVIVIDLKGVVMFWNKASEETFGYSRQEMLGRPLSHVYPSVVQEKFEHDLKRLKEGRSIHEQWRSITKDGSIVWIDIQTQPLTDEKGNAIAFIASANNIQNLKKTEKQLEESQALANAILEVTSDGIMTVDKSGYIQDCNKKATEIFGYSKAELIHTNFEKLILCPLKAKGINLLDYLNNSLHDRRYKEMLGKAKDDSLFPLEISIREVMKKEDDLFTIVINDISQRRQLEQEILQISEKERKRMGQDLHDGLGQMLTGIGLISQSLAGKLQAKGVPEAGDVIEISNLIKKADKYAKSIVQGMMHIDIEEKGLTKALSQLCNQAEKLFKINCHSQTEEKLNIPNTMIAHNMYRIAQEAINNAVKNGRAENIKMNLQTEDGSLKLTVVDDGTGTTAIRGENSIEGIGLKIMKYRADIVSGRIELNEQGDKNQLTCTIPLNDLKPVAT